MHPFKIKVLMYHAILKQETGKPASYYHATYQKALEKHLKYCKRYYHFIHPDEYLIQLEQGKPIPKRSLLLTFDDGYQNIFDYAFPILKKLRIPFLVFFNTVNLDKKAWLWFSRLKALEQRSNQTWLDLSQAFSDLSKEQIQIKLRKINAPKRQGASLQERSQFDGASISSIKEALQSGLLVCGGHTNSHAKLTVESDDVVRLEVEENKRFLESTFGQPLKFFAYPEGLISPSVAQFVKRAGYQAAFTVNPPDPSFPRELYQYHIPRIGIFRDHSLYFMAKIKCIDQLAKNLIR